MILCIVFPCQSFSLRLDSTACPVAGEHLFGKFQQPGDTVVNLLVYIFCFLFHCTSVIFTIRSFTDLESGAMSAMPYSYSLLTLLTVTWLIVAFLLYYTIRAGGTAYQIGITYSVFLILVSLDFFNAVAANPMRMAIILFSIAAISIASLIPAIAASGSSLSFSFSNIRSRLRNFLRNRKKRTKKADSPSDTFQSSSGTENLNYDVELTEIKFSVPLLKSIFVPLGKIASSVENDEERLKIRLDGLIRDFGVPENIRGYVQDLFEEGTSLSPSTAFLSISNSALEQYGSSLKYKIMKNAADCLQKADSERQQELFILLAKAYRIEQKDTERLLVKYLRTAEKSADES